MTPLTSYDLFYAPGRSNVKYYIAGGYVTMRLCLLFSSIITAMNVSCSDW